MRVRVVAYAPDALTRYVAGRVTEHLSADRSEVRCRRYEGLMGPVRMWHDRSRRELPGIEVDPLIGPVDALIVGAPLEAGRLAAPMATLLARPHRIPPVLGVFATCVRRRPALGFEQDVLPLANNFGGPETLILSQRDREAAGDRTPRALAAFLDRLAPIVRIPTHPVVLPVLAA